MSIFDFLTFIYLKKTIWSSLKYLNCEKSNIFFASDKKNHAQQYAKLTSKRLQCLGPQEKGSGPWITGS